MDNFGSDTINDLLNLPNYRLAFNIGKIEQCEIIKQLAEALMISNVVNPLKPQNDTEKGMIIALSAIIDSCNKVTNAISTEAYTTKQYDA